MNPSGFEEIKWIQDREKLNSKNREEFSSWESSMKKFGLKDAAGVGSHARQLRVQCSNFNPL